MNLLITKKVDGIILVGSNFIYEKEDDNKYILDAAGQVPVMLLNAAMDAPNVSASYRMILLPCMMPPWK